MGGRNSSKWHKIPKNLAEYKVVKCNGLSLPEVMISVAIVGILSAIAVPSYLNQVQKSRQSEAVSALVQLQTTLVAYVDENNTTKSTCGSTDTPTWGDLNGIAAIMTEDGPANDCQAILSAPITMPSGHYTLEQTDDKDDDNYYEFTASNSNAKEFNAMACVDLVNGASDIEKGNGVIAIEPEDLNCR